MLKSDHIKKPFKIWQLDLTWPDPKNWGRKYAFREWIENQTRIPFCFHFKDIYVLYWRTCILWICPKKLFLGNRVAHCGIFEMMIVTSSSLYVRRWRMNGETSHMQFPQRQTNKQICNQFWWIRGLKQSCSCTNKLYASLVQFTQRLENWKTFELTFSSGRGT